MIIAPAYQLADKALVDRWTDYVKKGGNLVLTCRTAQKDRHGRLPEAPFGSMINELTGNEMEFMIYYFLKNWANYGWMEKNIRGILGERY